MGPLDALTYGNGVTLALAYDLDGRMEALDAFDGGTPILDLDYGFDLSGDITNIADTGGGPRGRAYVYDALHRLEDASGGIPAETYGWDAVSNRTARTVGGASETYAYDVASNQLDTVTVGAVVRTLGYGLSGNTASDDDGLGVVLTHLYDSTDRLSEVKQGVATLGAYVHNAAGQRVSKTVGGVTTHYLYNLSGTLIAEADGATGAAQAEYVSLGGMPLAFITGGAVFFVHADHLGTPQRLTDGAGAVVWDANYTPFGDTTITGSLTYNLRFPGQYYDAETGLHYNYFRTYDPGLGRYIESDPIGLRGGWNTYAYVGGNPVTFVDPKGLIFPSTGNPNVNGGSGACPVMFNATCVDACNKWFEEKEEWRLDFLLQGLSDCNFAPPEPGAEVSCKIGVLGTDWALVLRNRRGLKNCLKKCGSA